MLTVRTKGLQWGADPMLRPMFGRCPLIQFFQHPSNPQQPFLINRIVSINPEYSQLQLEEGCRQDLSRLFGQSSGLHSDPHDGRLPELGIVVKVVLLS